MTAAPRVSVVIPAFNAAACLGRAVASVLDQTGIPPAEIVIVDDCSTDDTAGTIATLVARHPGQIQTLSNLRNLGPAGTRNSGIAVATGDWIAVLDADDAFEPGRLARLVAVAEREGVDAIADLLMLYDLAAERVETRQPVVSGGVERLRIAALLAPDPESGLDLGLLKPVFRRRLAETGLWRYPEGVRHAEDLALYVDLLRRGVSFALLREAHYRFSTRIGAESGQFSPGSVTNVNYIAVADQAAALLDDMRRSGDITHRIEELLEERIARMRRQNRVYCWTVLRRGERRRLLTWLWSDARNPLDLLAVLGQKLSGKRGLPD